MLRPNAIASTPHTVYTYTMHRTQIYLSQTELVALGRLSKATGKNRSQLIREALAQYQGLNNTQESVQRALLRSAGAWKRTESGETTVERLRPGRLAARVSR